MQSSPRIEELRQKFHENPRRYFAPLANEYRKAGDSQQAIAICRAHLAQQPRHMSGHVVYGQALYDAGRTEESRVVFEQALALDPENVIVLRHLGDIARRSGDVHGARDWYSRALDLDPQDAEIAAYVAELTEPLTSGTEEAALHATSQNKPPIITRTLAELYLQQGHVDSALEIYRQLAVREPDDPSIRGRIDELVRDLEIAHPEAVEMPFEITPEPAEASSQDARQEAIQDAGQAPIQDAGEEAIQGAGQRAIQDVDQEAIQDGAEEPIEAEPSYLEQSPAVEQPPELELTAENEPIEAKEIAPTSFGRLEHESEEPAVTETGNWMPSDEKHFSESDLSSEPWDADDFWAAESFAEAGETDQIFGLPYDSQGEPEEKRPDTEEAVEHETRATFSADITAPRATETGAATGFDEEDVQSIGEPEAAVSEAAGDRDTASAEPTVEPAAPPEEAIAAFATNGEMTTAAEEAGVAAEAEAPVSGSPTAEWMSLTSRVEFDEAPTEASPDAAPMGLDAEVEAQPAALGQASEAQPEAEPQADGDAEPQPDTQRPPTVPKREPERMPEPAPETVPQTVPETVPETMPKTVPERVPETLPGTVPESAPKALQETMADTAPQTEPEPEPKPERVMEPALPATQAAEPLTLDHGPSLAETSRRGARITVREFFATLGTARAPIDVSRLESAQSESAQPDEATQREESESEAAQPAAQQPESPQADAARSTPEAPAAPEPEEKTAAPVVAAEDAFSRLFADSPVSPEDSRAAAALSGAVAHEHALPSIDTPSVLHPSRELASPAGRSEPPQESEEDLRRFREWLDGLTES